ncbi:uncharacterized protein LOC144635040 isoform X2 [Oculina patagonica]
MSSPNRGRGRGRGRGSGQPDESASGSGQTDEMPLDKWKTWDDFCDWFWVGSNGNDLIKKLNASKKRVDFIRREKYRPVVYCIVLNDGQFPGKTKDETKTEVQWKLCKVGFTQVDTATGTNNRMEDVRKKICSKYESKREGQKASPSVLFVLSIGAVDTTPYLQTEKRIREAVGWPIGKKLAKENGLPCSTEWVLTTQAFIEKIKESIDQKKKEGTADPIDLFKTLKYRDPKAQNPKPPSEWLDEKQTTVGKFT